MNVTPPYLVTKAEIEQAVKRIREMGAQPDTLTVSPTAWFEPASLTAYVATLPGTKYVVAGATTERLPTIWWQPWTWRARYRRLVQMKLA